MKIALRARERRRHRRKYHVKKMYYQDVRPLKVLHI
jgi:hypothetical protein